MRISVDWSPEVKADQLRCEVKADALCRSGGELSLAIANFEHRLAQDSELFEPIDRDSLGRVLRRGTVWSSGTSNMRAEVLISYVRIRDSDVSICCLIIAIEYRQSMRL